jgi:hypothetical protein
MLKNIFVCGSVLGLMASSALAGADYEPDSRAGTSVQIAGEVPAKQMENAIEKCALDLIGESSERGLYSALGGHGCGWSTELRSGDFVVWDRISWISILSSEDLTVLRGDPEFRARTGDSLPYFTFEEKIDDTSYDDLGFPIPGGEVLIHLELHYPKNFGRAVPLINTETGHATRFPLDEVAFVDCLRSELNLDF